MRIRHLEVCGELEVRRIVLLTDFSRFQSESNEEKSDRNEVNIYQVQNERVQTGTQADGREDA